MRILRSPSDERNAITVGNIDIASHLLHTGSRLVDESRGYGSKEAELEEYFAAASELCQDVGYSLVQRSRGLAGVIRPWENFETCWVRETRYCLGSEKVSLSYLPVPAGRHLVDERYGRKEAQSTDSFEFAFALLQPVDCHGELADPWKNRATRWLSTLRYLRSDSVDLFHRPAPIGYRLEDENWMRSGRKEAESPDCCLFPFALPQAIDCLGSTDPWGNCVTCWVWATRHRQDSGMVSLPYRPVPTGGHLVEENWMRYERREAESPDDFEFAFALLQPVGLVGPWGNRATCWLWET